MLLFASIANQFPRPPFSDPKNQSQDLNRPWDFPSPSEGCRTLRTLERFYSCSGVAKKRRRCERPVMRVKSGVSVAQAAQSWPGRHGSAYQNTPAKMTIHNLRFYDTK